MTERPGDSIDEFLAELARAEAPADLGPAVMTRVRQTPRPPRRRPWMAVSALAAGLIIVASLGAVLLGRPPRQGLATPETTPSAPTATTSASGRSSPPSPSPTPVAAPVGSIRGTWRPIVEAPVQWRFLHSAVWTGREMIVWGGLPGPESIDDAPPSFGRDGAAYDPARGRWRRLQDAPIAGRAGHLATWTGEEMLVWGGFSISGTRPRLLDGAAYDPAIDRWRLLAPGPLRGIGGSAAAWTGREWLIVDGIVDAPASSALQVTTYDPEADSWASLPGLEIPPSSSVAAVWTGQGPVVVASPINGRPVAYAYRGGDAWSPIDAPPTDGLQTGSTVVWSGTEVLVPTSGGTELGGRPRRGLVAYDTRDERWRSIAAPPSGLPTLQPVWTGVRALFVGSTTEAVAYDPTSDTWLALAAADATRTFTSGVWAGDRYIAWGPAEQLPADGIAFVPDATFVEVRGETPAMVRTEIVDDSGVFKAARSASAEELSAEAPGLLVGTADIARLDDPRSLLVRWIGGPGDRAALLTITPDTRRVVLEPVRTYGDAMAVPYGVVLTFSEAVPPGPLHVEVVTRPGQP